MLDNASLEAKETKPISKKEEIKGIVWKYLIKFCDMTTLHGFKYLVEENRALIERIFWVIAIITASLYSGRLCQILVQKYKANSITIHTIPLGISVWTIPFPAITVCSNNQMVSSVFNFTDMLHRTNLTYTERQKVAVAQMLCNTDEGDELYLNQSIFLDFVKEVVPKLNETVENAVKISDLQNSLMGYFQSSTTVNGICHTLNGMPQNMLLKKTYQSTVYEVSFERDEYIKHETPDALWDSEHGYPTDSSNVYPWRVASDGVPASLILILKYNPKDYDNECNRGSRGFAVTVHNPVEQAASYVTSRLYVEAGYLGLINVDTHIFNTAETVKHWPPDKRGCFFANERTLLFYTNYTQRNCDNECKSLTAMKLCGCVAYYLPRNNSMPICGPKKWPCLWKSFGTSTALLRFENNQQYTRCNCLPSCNFITYQASQTNKKFVMTNHSLYRKLVANYSKKNREVNLTNRTSHMTFLEFVGNIGGIMSLFMGFSFLSLFELIYFLSIRIIFNVWKLYKPKEKKIRNVAPITSYRYPTKILW